MHDPIAPIWLVFPLAGLSMVITAGYLIALREASPSVLPVLHRRIRTTTGWVTMITLPMTAYGFGIANTAYPKSFMLIWVTITALLAFIFLLASIDLLLMSSQRRRITREHNLAIRATHREVVRLASGTIVPVPEEISQETVDPTPEREEPGDRGDA